MMTTFSQKIRVADIETFNGTPADLDVFDNSIKQCLMVQNLPLYYGGYVVGDPKEDYEYVAPNTRNTKPNYVIGRRLCAALTMKLKGTAACWWREYDRIGEKPVPNCWKPNVMRRALGSGTVNEVSLYLLLKEQFNGEVDARTAEIELGKFRWEPFKKDGLSVMAFQTTIDQLLRRAQKTSQFDRIRCIRNALPQAFRNQTRIFDSEKKLWKEINLIHVTMECDKLDRGDNNGKSNGKSVECSGCGRTGHTLDVC